MLLVFGDGGGVCYGDSYDNSNNDADAIDRLQ